LGFLATFLTWLLYGGIFSNLGLESEYLGWVVGIACLPGIFADVAMSRIGHGTGSIWLMVVVNFIFYFAATDLVFAIYKQLGAKLRGIKHNS